MKRSWKNMTLLLTGLVLGAALSGPAALAAENLQAALSHHRILVDGQEVQMEAYTINGANYVKLRDIGQAVDFEVYWDSTLGCVRVESGKPYTGQPPVSETAEEEETVKMAEAPAADPQDKEALKQEIVERTNAIRRDSGLLALTVNEKLAQAAQVRAEEMAASGIYSHTRPDGSKYYTVTDCRYVGENISQTPLLYLEQQKTEFPETVVRLWSNSAGHLSNMTDPNYRAIGIGLAQGTDSNGLECWYCVQLFLWDGYTIHWVDTPATTK